MRRNLLEFAAGTVLEVICTFMFVHIHFAFDCFYNGDAAPHVSTATR